MTVRGRGGGFGRRRRIALAVALLLVAILLALWLLRKSIAERYIDRALAAAKVPARYTIADLGPGRQRLTDVVIGDPARPDLVADWIETDTRITAHGAELSGVRAGRLRLRGRWVDGRLSLGAIDRLLPAPSGGAFALPKLALDVADGRMRLETPWGVAGVALRGRGRLDGGFAGRLAIVSAGGGTPDCAASRVAAVLRVTTGPRITAAGPVRAATVACNGVVARAPAADLVASFDQRTRGWTAETRLAVAGATQGGNRLDGLSGTLTAGAKDGRIEGALDLAAAGFAGGPVAGSGARLVGRYVYGASGLSGNGITGFGPGPGMRLTIAHARVAPGGLAAVARMAKAAAGTPVAPLAVRLSAALTAAARDVAVDADVQAERYATETGVTLHRLALRAASGARIDLRPGGRIGWYRTTRFGSRWMTGRGWVAGVDQPGTGLSANGTLLTGGGGLPDAQVRLSQDPTNGPLDATVTMRPYAAGDAALALAGTRLRYLPGPGTLRIVTTAALSGPLPGGRVERLALPLDLRIVRGAIVANPGCTPVAFDAFALSGLRLRPARLRLCPTGAGLVRVAGERVAGGARLAAADLRGTLGGTPLTLGLAGATLRLADRGFALEQVAARLGAPGRATRLDLARLEGRAGPGGLAGTFAGGAGQIANVPLLLSDAAGGWRFARGTLAVDGALKVRDVQDPNPRFQPMEARGVALTLAGDAIRASGVLHEPTTGTKVADVRIAHALGAGTGAADLGVPGLTFAKGFQPELLTRLTYGVVADVAGTVTGEGHIAWGPAGVTSTGTFRTAGTDLAAAFGPVTGLAGTIRFTDLLALESAPDQVATLKSVNPGVPVNDGIVRYRLLRDTRVAVAGGEWPFAGGRLTLDPTLLDFGWPAERRMTFRVQGMAADRFLQQFDFKNLDATGVFDGVLPMVFDESGGRIENGRMAVRDGGGTIRYVGELTEKDLGVWGNFAFQSLKSLRYRSLAITMNGPLAGEMITDVRFAGVSQGEGAKSNFVIRRLQRLPLVFNIRIRAPFRGLLDSAQGFYDPRRLVQRNLPALIERQNAVQPPESASVPQETK